MAPSVAAPVRLSVSAQLALCGMLVAATIDTTLQKKSFIRRLDREPNVSDIVSFNDALETTHADVLRIYDLAIASARETTP